MAAGAATWNSVFADQGPAARPEPSSTVPPHRGPTALRRGLSALRPTAHAKKKPKAPRTPVDKSDPLHPLRGGGKRRRRFAPRPARKKGSAAWLAQQLDAYQRRTLRIAFDLYEQPERRLKYCKQLREQGVQKASCPLRPVSKHPCSDEVCHCLPHYRILVGMDGGMGTGKPDFVKDLFATWRSAKRATERADEKKRAATARAAGRAAAEATDGETDGEDDEEEADGWASDATGLDDDELDDDLDAEGDDDE